METLKAGVECLYFPGDAEYEAARKNGTWMLDPVCHQKPSANACVKTPQNILAAVRFALATGVKIQAACGRHSHENMVQGSLCVDLSTHMDFVRVDVESKTVAVGKLE